MRLIIEGLSGPAAGLWSYADDGETIRVGRDATCELIVPGDDTLAPVHFLLGNHESTARLVDPGPHGVRINDQPARDVPLESGDVVLAGGSSFLVILVRGGLEQRLRKASPALDTATLRAFLILAGQSKPLYALVDAARDPAALPLLRSFDEEFSSLYEGAGTELDEVAPYLVRLTDPFDLLEELVKQGWDHSWGYYLTSEASFPEVRRHFRKYLTVEGNGKQLYFRFYDPRVLHPFLATCTREETVSFFGPVRRILAERKNGLNLSVLEPNQSRSLDLGEGPG